MSTLPCINCITLPICKAKMHRKDLSLGVYDLTYECSLLKNYLSDGTKIQRGSLTIHRYEGTDNANLLEAHQYITQGKLK